MSTKKPDGLGDRGWFVFVHDAKGGRSEFIEALDFTTC